MLKIARMLIARQLAAQIMQARALFPAVVLIGPRQVGKTTLARQIAQELGGKSIYLDLERPADLLQLRDEERFFKDHQDHLVILDEVQTRPELFARLRSGNSGGHVSHSAAAAVPR